MSWRVERLREQERRPWNTSSSRTGRVLGSYDGEMEAVEATAQKHELGTFLVQECNSDPESTVETFHSRVCFS